VAVAPLWDGDAGLYGMIFLFGWFWLLVFALVVCALIVAALSWAAQRRHPPIGTFIDVRGVRLHYLECGPSEGEAVVFLHGNGGMIQEQTPSGAPDLAARRYRVLCFDRPGYGYSTRPRFSLWTRENQAELFAAAFRQLGLGSVIVVGHSWGAMVAAALALQAPDVVRGVLLASGYYFPTARKDVWMFAGPAIPIVGDLFRFTIAPLLGRLAVWKLLDVAFAPQPMPDVFRAEYPVGLALRPLSLRASAEEAAYMIPSAARLQSRYGELPCPVVIMFGEEDRVIEPDQSRRLQQAIPRAVSRPVSDAGHMVHYADPKRLVDGIHLLAGWKDVAGQAGAAKRTGEQDAVS